MKTGEPLQSGINPEGQADGAARTLRPREIQRGVVAYLDVLGTKGVPSGAAAIDYATRLLGLRKFADSQIKGAMGLLRSFYAVLAEAPGLAEASVDHFSDSTFLWVPIDEGHEFIALSEISAVLVRLVHYGFAHRLPLRGAVSIGSFVVGEGIFVGDAVAEAVEWERLAQWSGVVFAPSASGPVIEQTDKAPEDPRLSDFAWVPVPTRGSPLAPTMNLLTLAWPNYLTDDFRPRIDRMYLSEPMSLEVASKYLNTISYFDEVRSLASSGQIPPPSEAGLQIVRQVWDGDNGVTVLPPAPPLPE